MTAPAVAKPKRRKWARRVLWSMAALFVGVCLFWCWSYWTALSERDALIAEIRVRGEPVWWEELCEKLVKEDPADSGASYFLQAIATMPPIGRAGRPLADAYAIDDRIRNQFSDPRVDPEVEADLKLGSETFDLLEESVKRSPGRLTQALRLKSPMSIRFSELEWGRQITRLLRWQVYDALSKSDAERAYHAIWLGLAASEQLAREPFDWPQILRDGLRSTACWELLHCLSRLPVSDRDFARLDQWLARWDDDFEARDLIIVERAFWMSVFGIDFKLKSNLQGRAK